MTTDRRASRRRVGMRKTPHRGCGVFREGCPAASYSPTPSPGQYHRRCRAELPGSEWDRAFPLRYDRRNFIELLGFVVPVSREPHSGREALKSVCCEVVG